MPLLISSVNLESGLSRMLQIIAKKTRKATPPRLGRLAIGGEERLAA